MASNTSYARKYFSVTSNDLPSIPVVAGNVISVTDTDALYYDAPDDLNNVRGTATRRKASGIRFVGTLPKDPKLRVPGVIYITEHGIYPTTNKPIYKFFTWDDARQDYVEISNNNNDNEVLIKPVTDVQKMYLTGDTTLGPITTYLYKNTDVYLTLQENNEYLLNVNISGRATTAINANFADSATSAHSATYDSEGDNAKIISDYVYDVYQSGNNITFAKGSGATTSVTITDTTYGRYTSQDDGLVPNTSESVVDTSGLMLMGSGWVLADSFVANLAAKSTNDGLDQEITSTYIKSIELNGTTISITSGDGTPRPSIELPTYSYSEYTGTTAGLVPANGGSITKYLSGMGTWEDAPRYDVFSVDSQGLVPIAPSDVGDSVVLNAQGEWIDIGGKVTSESTDDKLYMLGTTMQSSDMTTPYTQSGVYIENGSLYSNSTLVATADNAMALSNKHMRGSHSTMHVLK